jgi:hypothetical protein
MKRKADSSARKPKSSAPKPEQRQQRGLAAGTETSAVLDAAGLLSDLRSLIQSARQRIATVAYSTQTLLCWDMGRRLFTENLQGGRAAYGKQILVTVSRELTAEYGRGFSYAEIARMIQFAQLFPDEAIIVTLSQQLSWSHFHALLPIKDPLARDFYAEMCRIERWDVRTLRRKIAVELKLESFQPAHVGQMELYLRWLDKYERAPGEEAPIGLILCAGADAEQVELLELDAKSIRVAEYLTELPPLPLLRQRLHQAIEHAREQAARRLTGSEEQA